MSGAERELRIVFMGTPEFAVPSLEMLIDGGYNIVAVVCQPDRPKGRGHKLAPPPVKELAQKHEIPVLQYERVSREGLEEIAALEPDLFVTVAFGQILSRALLAVPRLGCINVHGSLLPKYRGAAPIEMAIINGETVTGVTTMFTVYELDAGDMLQKREITIPPNMTGGELREKMATLGAECLMDTIAALEHGTLTRTPQDETEATYYPMFSKGFDRLDFTKTAKELHDLARALDPSGAYAVLESEKYRVYAISRTEAMTDAAPGTIIAADTKQGLIVAAGDGAVCIEELKRPGGKRMTARDMLRGKSLPVGAVFGAEEKL